jgi:hypothetical protein
LVSLVGALVLDTIRDLDMIVFLPLDAADGTDVPDDQKLRSAVDSGPVVILADDEFGVVSSGGAAIVEARGSTAKRLWMLEEAKESHLV